MIIDISYSNNITDWRRVAAAVDGVIIRLGYTGYGSGKITYDKRYFDNIAAAKQYEIPRGIYYFPASITAAEAEKEADFIFENVAGEELPLGIWLDSEIADVKNKSGRADKLSRAKRTEFLHIIIDRLKGYGITAGVYASTSWLLNNLDMGMLPGVPVWAAQYNSKHECTYPGDYVLFQYSSKGSIPGIAENVDLNVKHEGIAGGVVYEDRANLKDAIETIAQLVIAGYFGQGHEQRKNSIYELIRKRVNDILK